VTPFNPRRRSYNDLSDEIGEHLDEQVEELRYD